MTSLEINFNDVSNLQLLNLNYFGSSVYTGTLDQKIILFIFTNTNVTSFPDLENINIQLTFNNDRFYKFQASKAVDLLFTVIHPSLPEDIKKFAARHVKRILETPEIYAKNILGNIKSQNLTWINHIFDGKSEQKNILYMDDQFIFLPDMKWNGAINQLHCLAIVKNKSLMSIRDLTENDLPLLNNIYDEGIKTIRQEYGILEEQLKVYLHYYPTFWRLHVHFTILACKDTFEDLNRCFSLKDIINNINLIGDYYQKSTMELLEEY